MVERIDDNSQALEWDMDDAIYGSTGALVRDVKDIASTYEVSFSDVVLASALNLFARFVFEKTDRKQRGGLDG